MSSPTEQLKTSEGLRDHVYLPKTLGQKFVSKEVQGLVGIRASYASLDLFALRIPSLLFSENSRSDGLQRLEA